jgi:hypothetical protein
MLLIECTYTCSYCLTENNVSVDPTGGVIQDYVEDCAACCRPNQLHIVLDAGGNSATVGATPL